MFRCIVYLCVCVCVRLCFGQTLPFSFSCVCGKMVADFQCVSQPTFGRAATPGGSDWKHGRMTRINDVFHVPLFPRVLGGVRLVILFGWRPSPIVLWKPWFLFVLSIHAGGHRYRSDRNCNFLRIKAIDLWLNLSAASPKCLSYSPLFFFFKHSSKVTNSSVNYELHSSCCC